VSILGIEVEDRGHTGVGEAGKGERLAAKSFPGRRVAQRAAQVASDGDDPIQVGVVCLPDLAHPALTDAFTRR